MPETRSDARAATAVVVDTNAALLPFTDGTDLEAELQTLLGAISLWVPTPVRQELESLAEGNGATAGAARAALRWLRSARVAATDLPGDDGVLAVARAKKAALLSNDRRLQREARRSGLAVVASRGHGRLHRLDA